MVVEFLCWGYLIPFFFLPPLSADPIPFVSYSPGSIKGKALLWEILSLIDKGAVELAPPSPGFYGHLFLVWKTLGSWRPIIDLSFLNKFVLQSKFKMETNQSVLRAVWRGDWMVSIDLKNAYFQVPVHLGSRRYLHFKAFGKICQFKVFYFGLSNAPQVFTRVMAPVSAMLYSLGVRILQYLDNWLFLASSQSEALWAKDTVLDLCRQLGIVINLNKSHLSPSQLVAYLGMVIRSPTLKAFTSLDRISALLLQIEEFLSYRMQNIFWRNLLGHLSPLSLLVPSGCLRMRFLQLVLRDSWDFQDESVSVPWTPSILEDLRWCPTSAVSLRTYP